MSRLLEALVLGVSSGSLYALIGIGFTLLFATGGYFNFAHGNISMFSAMVAAAIGGGYVETDITLVGAGLTAVAVGTALVVGLYHLVLRHARSRDVLTSALIMFGLSSVLEGAALWFWGPQPHYLASLSSLRAVTFGGAVVQPISLIEIGVTAAILGLLSAFLMLTRIGRALGAWSENPEAAALAGIPVHSMLTVACALSGALAGVAGFFYMGIAGVDYTSGLTLVVYGFASAALGGFKSLPRTVAGALAIGLIESVSATYVGGADSQLVSLSGILVLILYFAGTRSAADRAFSATVKADRANF